MTIQRKIKRNSFIPADIESSSFSSNDHDDDDDDDDDDDEPIEEDSR